MSTGDISGVIHPGDVNRAVPRCTETPACPTWGWAGQRTPEPGDGGEGLSLLSAWSRTSLPGGSLAICLRTGVLIVAGGITELTAQLPLAFIVSPG